MRALAITTSALALACAHETNTPTVTLAPSPPAAFEAPLRCSPDDPSACHVLARRALPTDPRDAFMFESIACEQKLAAACGSLGWMMLHGVWGEADPAQAVVLLEGACRADVVTSCVDLGVLERDVHTDDAKAAAIFSRYCEKNVAAACDELGRMVERGRGFAADADAALRLFERACHAGSAAGCGDSDACRTTASCSSGRVVATTARRATRSDASSVRATSASRPLASLSRTRLSTRSVRARCGG